MEKLSGWRLLVDYHDAMAQKLFRFREPLLPDKPVSDEIIEKLLNPQVDIQELVDRYVRRVPFRGPLIPRFPPSGEGLATRIWEPGTNRRALSNLVYLLGRYYIGFSDRKALVKLAKEGVGVTILSATPAHYEDWLRIRMGRDWGRLDQNNPALLRISNSPLSEADYKAVALAAVKRSENQRKIILYESHYSSARDLSRLFDIPVCLRDSEEKAKKQPGWPVPVSLEELPEELHYGCNLMGVYEVITQKEKQSHSLIM